MQVLQPSLIAQCPSGVQNSSAKKACEQRWLGIIAQKLTLASSVHESSAKLWLMGMPDVGLQVYRLARLILAVLPNSNEKMIMEDK